MTHSEPAIRAGAATGLPLGTTVMTLDGALPVEHLTQGDRIVTRAGARILRAVTATLQTDAAMVAVGAGALGHDRPGRPLLLPADQPVLVRDWRARALWGVDAALVPVARLADGEHVRRVQVAQVRLFALSFDDDAVIYADGVEVGCPRVPVAA